MGTQITFRRGSSFPTAGSGITLSEPVFETTLHTFHIGLGHGVTAEWVGAPISGLSADIAAGITYKITTAASVLNYISGLCYGNTGAVTITQYVSSFNGSTGAVQGVSSFNGLTGAVGGVCASQANTFTALQSFSSGISASGITVNGNMSVTGNFTVSGGVTFTTSETVLIEDNIITLNSNVTGSPSENAGIEIERGTSANVQLLWNESSDQWTFTNDGSTYYDLPTSVVTSFNGRTGAVQGVSSAAAGTGISVSAATGAVTITNTGVLSFNGNTGVVQGVSAAVAGTGISVSGATGSVTITNTGVQSFNGNTGAVTGASLGANTFTGLNTFNAGVTTSFLYASTGSTFGSTLQVNGGATFAGRVDVGGILDVVGGTTFESTTDHAGVARFASGVTISGTLNGATATFSRWLSAPIGISAQTITSRGNSLVLSGLTSGVISSGSQIILPVADGIQLNGYGGAVALSSAQAGSVSYNTSLKFMSEDTLNEIYGSVTLTPPSYTDGDYTLYLPNTANGTLALTSQLMGAVNGSTAATTAVTSFNGRTGAVQGVSSWNGQTGAISFVNYVTSVNGATGAVTNVAKTNQITTFSAASNVLTVLDATSGKLISITPSADKIVFYDDNSGNDLQLYVNNYGNQVITFPDLTCTVAGRDISQTFTALQTFSAGISAAGATFTSLVRFNAGISAAGATLSSNTNIPSGSTLTVAGIITSDTGYRISSSAINSQTGTTYTFLESDNGKVVTFNNGSAVTVTIPTALPVGFNCTAIQLGAGQVGFTAASGVTLQSYGAQYRLIGQHASASIIEYSTNIVNLSGNLVV